MTFVISNGLSSLTLKKNAYIRVDTNTTHISDDCPDRLVSVSPNPSDGRIQVKINYFNGGTYSLYSSLGELLSGGAIRSDNFISELDFTGKPAGIYLLRVSASGKSLSKKIVIY